MQRITSVQNDKIKYLKALKTKKGREENNSFLLEGLRAVSDAIKHNVKFKTLLVEESLNFDLSVNCECIEVSKRIIEALSETSSPEGLIAEVSMLDHSFDVEKLNGFTVFLDRLQDAGNLGTIIRTADAAGADAVILSPECVELYNPKTVRSTVSSLFNIKIMYAENSVDAIKMLKAHGYTVYGAALDGDNYYSMSIDKNTKNCIVIGNEGNGITSEVLETCDKKTALPMVGGAESLNAAVAAGILIYGFLFGK